MTDQSTLERIDEDIVRRYPYPLAATYSRAYFQVPDPADAHEYLLDLSELALKYCAVIAISHYLQDVHAKEPRISAALRTQLNRPSLGHWQSWTRDILNFYRRTESTSLISELRRFYEKKHSGDILTAATGLTRMMKATMGFDGGVGNATSISTQGFFDLMITYRNKLAHGAHPSSHVREQIGGILRAGLRSLLQEMSFAADYRLVFVEEVSVKHEAGHKVFPHQVTSLTGDSPRVSPTRHVLAESYPDKRVYVLDANAEFHPLLSLHPLLIFRYCDSCNREQAFFLNMSDEQTQDYLSYQCSHHFSPTEYLDDMQVLLSGLDGAMPLPPPSRPGLDPVSPPVAAEEPSHVPEPMPHQPAVEPAQPRAGHAPPGPPHAAVPTAPPPPPRDPWSAPQPPRGRPARDPGEQARRKQLIASGIVAALVVLSGTVGFIIVKSRPGPPPTPPPTPHLQLADVLVRADELPGYTEGSSSDVPELDGGGHSLRCTPDNGRPYSPEAKKALKNGGGLLVENLVAHFDGDDAITYMDQLNVSVKACTDAKAPSKLTAVGDDNLAVDLQYPQSATNPPSVQPDWLDSVVFVRKGNLVAMVFIGGTTDNPPDASLAEKLARTCANRMARVNL